MGVETLLFHKFTPILAFPLQGGERSEGAWTWVLMDNLGSFEFQLLQQNIHRQRTVADFGFFFGLQFRTHLAELWQPE